MGDKHQKPKPASARKTPFTKAGPNSAGYKGHDKKKGTALYKPGPTLFEQIQQDKLSSVQSSKIAFLNRQLEIARQDPAVTSLDAKSVKAIMANRILDALETNIVSMSDKSFHEISKASGQDAYAKLSTSELKSQKSINDAIHLVRRVMVSAYNTMSGSSKQLQDA